MKEMSLKNKRTFPGEEKAFEQMCAEAPLIDIELTDQELADANHMNRLAAVKMTTSTLAKKGYRNTFIILNLCALIFILALTQFSFYSILILVIVNIVAIGLYKASHERWLDSFTGKDKRCFMSFSGVYFLGKFSPFRLPDSHLTTVSLDNDPSSSNDVLKLIVHQNLINATSISWFHSYPQLTILIPLRSETAQDYDKIAAALLPNIILEQNLSVVPTQKTNPQESDEVNEFKAPDDILLEFWISEALMGYAVKLYRHCILLSLKDTWLKQVVYFSVFAGLTLAQFSAEGVTLRAFLQYASMYMSYVLFYVGRTLYEYYTVINADRNVQLRYNGFKYLGIHRLFMERDSRLNAVLYTPGETNEPGVLHLDYSQGSPFNIRNVGMLFHYEIPIPKDLEDRIMTFVKAIDPKY